MSATLNRIGLALVVMGLALGAERQASAELVVNGDFEDGNFTGWSFEGNYQNYFTVESSATDPHPVVPHSGTYYAKIGPVGSLGYLYQNITTTPGDQYTISFWLQSDGQAPNQFTASFGATTLLAPTYIPATSNPGSNNYVEYTYTVTAQGITPSKLEFGFQDDPGYFHLDDVSVTDVGPGLLTATPEPSTLISVSLGALLGLGHVWRHRKRASA